MERDPKQKLPKRRRKPNKQSRRKLRSLKRWISQRSNKRHQKRIVAKTNFLPWTTLTNHIQSKWKRYNRQKTLNTSKTTQTSQAWWVSQEARIKTRKKCSMISVEKGQERILLIVLIGRWKTNQRSSKRSQRKRLMYKLRWQSKNRMEQKRMLISKSSYNRKRPKRKMKKSPRRLQLPPRLRVKLIERRDIKTQKHTRSRNSCLHKLKKCTKTRNMMLRKKWWPSQAKFVCLKFWNFKNNKRLKSHLTLRSSLTSRSPTTKTRKWCP